MSASRATTALMGLVWLASCAPSVHVPSGPPVPVPPGSPMFLDQGWTASERQAFYTTSQGSQLIRLDWLQALEQPGGANLFLADSLARFGYLPNPGVPNGLPVGFVVDRQNPEWVGMTCAACHTSQISYQGTNLQIDGAPTDADLQKFLAEMASALTRTSTDDTKFGRFADRVAKADPKARLDLRRELTRYAAYFDTFVSANTPPFPWGPARADAFGLIFNRVSAIDLPRQTVWQPLETIESNNQPPNAPVSYPYLWGTSRYNHVQWDGIAPNSLALDRLVRNAVEVLGVFARVNLNSGSVGFESTVDTRNLKTLEEKLIKKLRSPIWPEDVFGKIDQLKAADGQTLFEHYCSSCHQPVDRDKESRVKVTLTPLANAPKSVNTDPLMAQNVACRKVDTGVLQGTLAPPPSWKLKPVDCAATLASDVGFGVLLRQALFPSPAPANTATPWISVRSAKSVECATDLLVYISRPLDGIWASPPYLHNGSVPTLFDLLRPSGERPKSFHVGSRNYDPVGLGFEDSGSFFFDTTKPGNANTGHEYGTSLSDVQRYQILEYLKLPSRKLPGHQ